MPKVISIQLFLAFQPTSGKNCYRFCKHEDEREGRDSGAYYFINFINFIINLEIRGKDRSYNKIPLFSSILEFLEF